MSMLSLSALTGLALLALSGCSKPNEETYYVLKCDYQTERLKEYTGVKTTDGAGLISIRESSEPGTDLNKPCSVSTDNLGRPYTLGEGFFTPDNPFPKLPASGPVAVDATPLTTLFPWMQPVLFSVLPGFANPQRPPLECPPGLGGFLVNHRQNTVTAFRACPTLRQVKEINVYANPLQVAVTPDGTQALVTSYGDSDGGALTFIKVSDQSVSATLRMFNYNPSGIAITPDGTRAYLTHYFDLSPSLVVVDIPGRKVLSTIPLPLAYPRAVMITPDGSQAWVNYYQGGIVSVVDLLTGTIGGTVTITQQVSTGMAFNPTGTKAFVASQPNLLHVVDTATLRVLTRIVVGQEPTDVVVTKDGNTVLVNSDVDPGTWWVDARSNRLLSRAVVPGAAAGGSMGLMVFQ